MDPITIQDIKKGFKAVNSILDEAEDRIGSLGDMVADNIQSNSKKKIEFK